MSTDVSTSILDTISLPPLEELAVNYEALSQLLIDVRRHLHRNPELGFKEQNTFVFIQDVLQYYGLHVQGPIAGTGCYVDIGDANEQGRVAYRADIDALPIQDAKNAPYRSEVPGVGHLCGHDAHASIGIGLALLLKARQTRDGHGYRVFFQPNEEGMPSGAPRMIRAGILNGVKCVFASHVDPTLPIGTYGLISGPATASADRFDVHVGHSSTGHSARPHETIDTVWVANQIAQNLYQQSGRITDARNANVLTICRFQAGGAYNVIPSQVTFGGTLRSSDPDDRDRLQSMIRETAEQIGELYGARIAVELEKGSPAVLNNPTLISLMEKTISSVNGAAASHHIDRASMGAEDFAHYTHIVPGALIRAGTMSGPDTSYPLHDDHFDIDESVLARTASLYARLFPNLHEMTDSNY